MAYMASKHYVVWKGRVPGIYPDWASANEQIEGFGGARYKSFSTREEAEVAYAQGSKPVSASRKQHDGGSVASKHYVVWKGRIPGIYPDWASAKEQIEDYDGARYKGFPSREEAEVAYAQGPKPLPAFLMHRDDKPEVPPSESPLLTAIAVDAACSGNPGVMEYRGVSLWDKKEVFHHKHDFGTNNIGEFLAIVEGLARLKAANANDITIYSDSKIAINWVHAKKCRTKLEMTPRTAELLDVVKRAEKWLHDNVYSNPIVKWPTTAWGEIPADFGRK